MKRRNFFKMIGAGTAVAMLPKFSYGASPTTNIVVVGGGLGGAAAAKYLKLWGGGNVNVKLITSANNYMTCIQSNLVATGALSVSTITRNYDTLQSSYGVTRRRGLVTAIDRVNQTVRVGSSDIHYDYLVLAPGVKGIPYSGDPDLTLSFWEGSKASALKMHLDHIPDGGTFVMYIPSGTIKGALAPYGRACAVADYLQSRGCKVIVLDGHTDIPSQKNDFVAAFQSFGSTLVAGTNNFTGPVLDYYAGVTLNSVNIPAKTLDTSMGIIHYHAANVIPPQRAALDWANDYMGNSLGLVPAGQNFASVDFQTFASTVDPLIYIIGDAQGTTLPKSGNIAADQAKIVASVITRKIAGITALETSLAVSAIQFNAIQSTNAHTAVYAHAGYQWNKEAHTFTNPANQTVIQSANSWVPSGDLRNNLTGTDSDAGVSTNSIPTSLTIPANISGKNYSQGLTWLDSLLADCYGA